MSNLEKLVSTFSLNPTTEGLMPRLHEEVNVKQT